MKLTTLLKKAIALGIMALCSGIVFAQRSLPADRQGAVRGTVTDDYGLYVPGATVLIEDLNKGVVTNFDGEYTFVDVAEGSHTVSVQYLGYATITEEVTVTAGETTVLDITLTAQNTELEEVIVTGYGFGSQAKALNTQKNRQNITNIVASDQIGKFPDANIGDAVKRIPGITMQMDQGEARDIVVRGLAPHLNSVTLNGSRIPSAEGDNRNVQMDLIPSDMIQSIEVSKAVTPDMEADALGGSINLVTRSAPSDFRLSATVGSGVNFINGGGRILNGSFLVGDRSENKKFGWMVSASMNDTDFGSDNAEAEWSNEFEYNTGEVDVEGEDILEEVDVNPYASVVEIRKYLVQRIRRSFSANMEYAFDPNNTVYFKGMYNWRDDKENRFATATEILDGEDIAPGDFTIENGNLISFPVEAEKSIKGGLNNKRSKGRRLEEQRMQNYSIGGDHLFGNLKMDWLGAYAKAHEKKPFERAYSFESEYMVNSTNSEKPLHEALSDITAEDFEFNEFEEEVGFTEEEDVNAYLNFELPANFFGKGNGIVKFGARGRFKNKVRDNVLNVYEAVEDGEFDGLTIADTDVITYNGEFLAGNQYVPGFFPSGEWNGDLDYANNSGLEGEEDFEAQGENFDVKENVMAGYLMVNQNLSDKLSVLAGVRVENTSIENLGNEVVFDDEGDFESINEIEDKNTYTNVLPGVHFKYNVNDNTVLRLAWTNTLSRPNYIDLVPYRSVINEDEEIFIGNPELNPTTSMNLDFMAEHYFKSVGIISGGVFYKDLKDFVYVFVTEDEATGYDLFQPLNGDNASIVGAEVSFQRQLDFLPGFAKNFSLYLNYTYLNATADGITNEDGDERGDLELPGSAPHMFNGSFAYSGKKFGARLSANFSDAYLSELGGEAFEDRYYDRQFFLDFNATFAINKNLRIYADLNNITNQPLRFYQGSKNQTMQMEYYGRRLSFGVKYDLF